MAEEQINPLTASLLQLVQGRQQSEVAKLTLLHSIASDLKDSRKELTAIAAHLAELLEREKAK